MNSLHVKSLAVMVIDDNDDDYEAIDRAFKKAGVTNPITRCRRGSEAMESFKTGKPLLILLDLNMPGMDGYTVLRRIKEDASLRRIPVIIWSTSSNDKDIDACYQAGANAYMQKPVTFEDLLASVRCLKEYWFEMALLPSDGKQP